MIYLQRCFTGKSRCPADFPWNQHWNDYQLRWGINSELEGKCLKWSQILYPWMVKLRTWGSHGFLFTIWTDHFLCSNGQMLGLKSSMFRHFFTMLWRCQQLQVELQQAASCTLAVSRTDRKPNWSEVYFDPQKFYHISAPLLSCQMLLVSTGIFFEHHSAEVEQLILRMQQHSTGQEQRQCSSSATGDAWRWSGWLFQSIGLTAYWRKRRYNKNDQTRSGCMVGSGGPVCIIIIIIDFSTSSSCYPFRVSRDDIHPQFPTADQRFPLPTWTCCSIFIGVIYWVNILEILG
jgi:hypothetical protein